MRSNCSTESYLLRARIDMLGVYCTELDLDASEHARPWPPAENFRLQEMQ